MIGRRAGARGALLTALLVVLGCTRATPPGDVTVTRAWQSETFAGCVLASPLAVTIEGRTLALVASGDGRVVALDPESGESIWSLDLPRDPGEVAHVVATPVLVPGDRLVVVWQDVAAAGMATAMPRFAHHVAVVDLAHGTLDPAFPVLELAAEQPSTDDTGPVRFSAANAYSRARLVHAGVRGSELGLVYVSFGNASDLQPFHGWLFELDLDGWRRGAAIRSTFVTTPTNDCGTPGAVGSGSGRCGGGIWSSAGPRIEPAEDGFALVVPTSNGLVDLDRRSYAMALMRFRGPGLRFDPRCDAAACADFDVARPSSACLESCEDLFLPRALAGELPSSADLCRGLSFLQCSDKLDWGGSSPARAELGDDAVYVLPSKDGAVYLIDADHLGTLHDRVQIVDACGEAGAGCWATWAGMIATRPAITELDGAPLALIPTFMPDAVHAAGVVALRIVKRGGVPRLERVWEAPPFDGAEAHTRFRNHPGAIRTITIGGEEFAAVVEQGTPKKPGRLHVIRVRDGSIRAGGDLAGPGQRFAEPLAIGERLIFPGCAHGNAGPGRLEAWDLRPR